MVAPFFNHSTLKHMLKRGRSRDWLMWKHWLRWKPLLRRSSWWKPLLRNAVYRERKLTRTENWCYWNLKYRKKFSRSGKKTKRNKEYRTQKYLFRCCFFFVFFTLSTGRPASEFSRFWQLLFSNMLCLILYIFTFFAIRFTLFFFVIGSPDRTGALIMNGRLKGGIGRPKAWEGIKLWFKDIIYDLRTHLGGQSFFRN